MHTNGQIPCPALVPSSPTPPGQNTPTRYREPGVRFDDLPPIGLVLISHSHCDYMDLPALWRLNEIHSSLFLAGLGTGRMQVRSACRNWIIVDGESLRIDEHGVKHEKITTN